jgi:hypothetical protein
MIYYGLDLIFLYEMVKLSAGELPGTVKNSRSYFMEIAATGKKTIA